MVAEDRRRASPGWVLAVCLAAASCAAAPSTPTPSPVASASAGLANRPVGIPGSRVRLGLAPGFCRPTRQVALVNRDGIALVIIEGNLPSQTTVSQWLAGLSEEMKKWASGTVETREIKRAGVEGTVSLMSVGKERTAVVDLAGDKGAFATVIATYDQKLEKTAEAVVSAVDLDARATLDPFAMIGLRLSDAAGFDLVAGPVPPVVLKEAGLPLEPGTATYSVAVLPAALQPAAAPADALRDVLTAQLAIHSVDLDPKAVSMTTIDGMTAAETTADEPGQDGARIYAAALMDQGAVLLFKGRVVLSRAGHFLERFQRMTRSVRRVPDVFKSFACE